MARSRYVYNDAPPQKTELSFEHGQRYAEEFLAKARKEPYPNSEYETFSDVVKDFGMAAFQALEGAEELLGDDPEYLERYCADIRGYLSRFD